MAQRIIFPSIPTNGRMSNQVKEDITNLQSIMGEGLTEEIGNAITKLVRNTYRLGYNEGTEDQLYSD